MGRDLSTDEARRMASLVKTHNGGRKRKAEEDEIRKALDDALPMSDVLARLKECVRSRQPWAITLWLAYRWGRPVERAELTGADGGNVKVEYVNDWRENTTSNTPRGAAGNTPVAGALPLAQRGQTLAEDDPGTASGN